MCVQSVCCCASQGQKNCSESIFNHLSAFEDGGVCVSLALSHTHTALLSCPLMFTKLHYCNCHSNKCVFPSEVSVCVNSEGCVQPKAQTVELSDLHIFDVNSFLLIVTSNTKK